MVTGLGVISPLGGDVASTWAGLLAGRSGVGALTEDWARELPVRIAARAPEPPGPDRAEALALVAARQAWADAWPGAGADAWPGAGTDAWPGAGADAWTGAEAEGWTGALAGDVDRDRLAVVLGTSFGAVVSLLEEKTVLRRHGPAAVRPRMYLPSSPAARVGALLGARAGVRTTTTACAAGSEALALGLDLIRAGRADVVVAGGVDASITRVSFGGFGAMRAMSTRNDEPDRASRPWDKNRDGFVLGEGAAILVLERADHARARGARIYARLAGAGLTSDGYDIVQPDPDCAGGTRAMRAAIRDAGLTGADIAHVNAHATSTPAGDMGEIRGIRAAVGGHPVLTATKSMTGHLLGAAGAVEAVATILALRDGVVPPTINLDDPDDALDLDVAAHDARRLPMTAAMSNSFGFGGHNVALVFTA